MLIECQKNVLYEAQVISVNLPIGSNCETVTVQYNGNKKPYWFQKKETLSIKDKRLQKCVANDGIASQQPGASSQSLLSQQSQEQSINDEIISNDDIGYIAGNEREGVTVKFRLKAWKHNLFGSWAM